MPLTFSLSSPVPEMEIQRQLMALQLLKVSRPWRYRGGWAPEEEMKAALLAKVTDPSCRRLSVEGEEDLVTVRLTGMPASWLMESEVSVKSSEKRALAVAAKLGAVGLARR